MPYRPAPTPPKTISPSCMLISGTMPASGMKLSCKALTAPQEVAVVTTAQSTESGDAEADLLALEVAAGLERGRHLVDAELAQQRVARLLDGQRHGQAHHEDDRRRGPERPALARVADHAAEGVEQRRPG